MQAAKATHSTYAHRSPECLRVMVSVKYVHFHVPLHILSATDIDRASIGTVKRSK